MPNLTLNNNTYAYPDPGSEPGWGQDATAWAEEATDILNSLAGTGSIAETQSIIQLNATNAEVAGLLFNASLIESADVTYRIYRKTDSNEVSEEGTLRFVYIPSAPEKWFMSRVCTTGTNPLVTMDIDVNGQVLYSSLPIAGTNYSGYIKFKTSTILRT